MSALLDHQIKFSQMVTDLIRFAYDNGYGITLGDAFRDPRCPYGSKNSLHRKRLAIDLNLFVRTPDDRWDYMALTEDHTLLGEYWESIGGTWGGRFVNNPDGNHYQLSFDEIGV